MMFYIFILLIMGAFTILNKQTNREKTHHHPKQQQQQQQDYVRTYGTNAGTVPLPLREPPFPISPARPCL